jgi:hypothetical protein
MNQKQLQLTKSALNEYETLTGKFQELIANHQDVCGQIKSVRLLESGENNLVIEIFGIRVIIQFSMVFQDETTPLGQVSALVDMKPLNSIRELSPIHTVWFDYMGNVTSSPSDGGDLGHVSYSVCLPTFIHSVAFNLTKSELMSPLL